MAEGTEAKWQGKATAELKRSTGEQIWPLLEEFCNLDKFFPSVDTCYRVEGNPGQPGLVRHCKGPGGWCNEKLLTIDSTNFCLSYEALENNVGLKNYVATLKVLPVLEGHEDGKPGAAAGCKIELSFVSDPVQLQGMKLEGFVSYIDDCVQFMAKKLEDAAAVKLKDSTVDGQI
ncbi:Polyketide cyclase/dehydrase [Corchorus capsularis]|uniref:Polyketide cyclase/dehydrase n=1 Tax=Corchorus capsularis TaxID=210143 RepID=A0A1R3JN45_COCAP|nr:Polyketide cyclase/dehydrase [Corchorus capsularis]